MSLHQADIKVRQVVGIGLAILRGERVGGKRQKLRYESRWRRFLTTRAIIFPELATTRYRPVVVEAGTRVPVQPDAVRGTILSCQG